MSCSPPMSLWLQPLTGQRPTTSTPMTRRVDAMDSLPKAHARTDLSRSATGARPIPTSQTAYWHSILPYSWMMTARFTVTGDSNAHTAPSLTPPLWLPSSLAPRLWRTWSRGAIRTGCSSSSRHPQYARSRTSTCSFTAVSHLKVSSVCHHPTIH